MQRTVVYKLKPTASQREGLQRYLDVTRAVYNAALEQRIAAYELAGETRSWVTQSRELREVRESGLLAGCHVHAAQLALRRLERSYDGFFHRCARSAKRKGFPRFKGRRYWRSFAFKEHANGWRIDPAAKRLRISGVGAIRVRVHRELAGEPRTLSVVRRERHKVCVRHERMENPCLQHKRRRSLSSEQVLTWVAPAASR